MRFACPFKLFIKYVREWWPRFLRFTSVQQSHVSCNLLVSFEKLRLIINMELVPAPCCGEWGKTWNLSVAITTLTTRRTVRRLRRLFAGVLSRWLGCKPYQSIWDLWWTKWYWERRFLQHWVSSCHYPLLPPPLSISYFIHMLLPHNLIN